MSGMSVLLRTLYNKHGSCLILSFPEQFVFPAYYKQQNHKESPALHIWCKQCPCLKKKVLQQQQCSFVSMMQISQYLIVFITEKIYAWLVILKIQKIMSSLT